MQSFGERIQAMRLERNLSQSELAKELEIHQTTISGIERNERLPSPELLMRFARFFDVPLDKLLDPQAWEASRSIARTARSTEATP